MGTAKVPTKTFDFKFKSRKAAGAFKAWTAIDRVKVREIKLREQLVLKLAKLTGGQLGELERAKRAYRESPFYPDADY